MPFELRVALRYLRSSRLQSGLILAGVAVGIVAYTFMAALITGLDQLMIDNVVGNLAHIKLEPKQRPPQIILPAADSADLLAAIQQRSDKRLELRGWRRVVEDLRNSPGVTVISPRVVGNAFLQRGEKIQSVEIIGVEAKDVSSIVDIEEGLLRGSTSIGPGDVLIGTVLSEELGVSTGQLLRLQSDRSRTQTLTVRGIFDVGHLDFNRRKAVVDLATGQSIFDLEGSVSRIEVNVADIFRATQIAERLGALSGLEATDWITDSPRLKRTLSAQRTTGDLIKFFSLLTIIIGVASVLLLAVNRRRSEIGIMLSMGVARRSIGRIFRIQGFVIGLTGSCLGAFLGWLFCLLVREAVRRPDGSSGLPVDPSGGHYLIAIVLATTVSTLAAVLPAYAAAQIDPVEVIQQ